MNETEEDNKPVDEQADNGNASVSVSPAEASTAGPATVTATDKPADDSATDSSALSAELDRQLAEAQAAASAKDSDTPEVSPKASPEASVEEAVVSSDAAVKEKEAPASAAKQEAAPKAKKPKAKKSASKSVEPEPLNISEDKSWYVVQAFSGYEASVKRSLLERIERAELTKFFGEILVPTEEVVEIRGGQKRKSERKFFPGYVLVQMDLNDETWHLVKNVPRVLGFIGGTADRPAPITDKEADEILQRVQDGVDKPRPKVLFDVGEVVRVTDGPFNDFNGVVEEVNFEKNKLLVAVQIFGRSTPVELEFSQVEKA